MNNLSMIIGLIMAAVVTFSVVKPINYVFGTMARSILLPLLATFVFLVFRQEGSAGTIGQLLMTICVIGWITCTVPVSVLYSSADGEVVVRSDSLEKKSLKTALASGAIIMTMALLQASTTLVEAKGGRGDIGAVFSFGICFIAWFSLVSSLTLPWAIHRRWTLPALIIASVMLLVLIPAAWFGSNGDIMREASVPVYDRYPVVPSTGYSVGGDPFSHATSSSRSITTLSGTFAASPSILTANILALISLLVATARYAIGGRISSARLTNEDLAEYIVVQNKQ